MEKQRRPLDDIIVLDFTQALSGPICTAILADYGARVIKVENTKGSEVTRGANYDPNVPVDNVAGGDNFYSINRNKDSISLNMRTDEGKMILKKLVMKADIVISNYRPGVTKKMEIDYETLSAINPRIICCEINAFREKARENEPAFDVVIQAASGVLACTGYPDGDPAKVGGSVCDISAGLHMVQGIMFALYERTKTGRGQAVNVRMQDAGMFVLAQYATPCIDIPGYDLKRNGMCHIEATPSNGYKTADGYILIAPASDKLFYQFCELIGRPDMITDPRFADGNSRLHHRPELDAIINSIFPTKTTDEWYQAMKAAGLPASPISTPRQAFNKANEEGSAIVQKVKHATRGTDVHVIGTVCELSETPGKVDRRAPMLGEHTLEVLESMGGFTEEEIREFESRDIVRCLKQ